MVPATHHSQTTNPLKGEGETVLSHKPLKISAVVCAAALTALTGPHSVAMPQEGVAQTTTADASVDTTDPIEAARVDSVPLPEGGIDWWECGRESTWCGRLDVPLDYDNPDGEKYTLRVSKRVANKPEEKIGSLFVNPGGPGLTAYYVPRTVNFMGQEVLDRFDIIGVDPRGVGGSHIANCFDGDDEAAGASFLDMINTSYPLSKLESLESGMVRKNLAENCSEHGSVILKHMSSTEVARDMDVVRRAVGDEKLNFIGFSYGSVISQLYANMYPDRVRAIVSDGVIDIEDWTGTKGGNGNVNQDERLWSSYGAEQAMHEMFKRCEEAGPALCKLASTGEGDPTAPEKLNAVIERLKPGGKLTIIIPNGDGTDYVADLGIGWLAELMIQPLYKERAEFDMVYWLSHYWAALQREQGKPVSEDITALMHSDAAKARSLRNRLENGAPDYNDGAAKGLGVACSDGIHPRTIAENTRRAYDARTINPVMGQFWSWMSVPCSGDVWKNQDKLAYMGPFGKKPATPMMFVGNLWDPATAHMQAASASKLHPGSSFVSSNNWGHTSYGTSECATNAIEEYLLRQTHVGFLECTDARQPFPAKNDYSAPKQTAQDVIAPFKPYTMIPLSE